MLKKSLLIFVFAFVIFSGFALADDDNSIEEIKPIALTIHTLELVLAVMISVITLKYFKITKPLSLFVYLYIAGGFFVINSAFFVLFFTLRHSITLNFYTIYIGSRIATLGMLVSLSIFFYDLHKKLENK